MGRADGTKVIGVSRLAQQLLLSRADSGFRWRSRIHYADLTAQPKLCPFKTAQFFRKL